MSRKVIGILGGMGPLATADIFSKIIDSTKAVSDQEHLRVIIDSNTDIPDRTDSLLHGGPSPVPELTKSARTLEAAGADMIIIPCNTAHGFLDEVRASVSIPVLSMIEAALEAVKSRGVTRAGLLSTTATMETGIYQKVFDGSGIELIIPPAEDRDIVMGVIYDGVKAGRRNYDTTEYSEVVWRLAQRGAEVMILACTELPPAMTIYGLSFPAVDPTLELALAAIKAAGGEVKDPSERHHIGTWV